MNVFIHSYWICFFYILHHSSLIERKHVEIVELTHQLHSSHLYLAVLSVGMFSLRQKLVISVTWREREAHSARVVKWKIQKFLNKAGPCWCRSGRDNITGSQQDPHYEHMGWQWHISLSLIFLCIQHWQPAECHRKGPYTGVVGPARKTIITVWPFI